MIQLIGNIDVFDNLGGETTASIINHPNFSSIVPTFEEVDISNLVNNENEDSYKVVYLRAQNRFHNDTSGIIAYDTKDYVCTYMTSLQPIMPPPIIKITTQESILDFYSKFVKCNKVRVLSNTFNDIRSSCVFQPTGYYVRGKYEYVYKIDGWSTDKYTIVSVTNHDTSGATYVTCSSVGGQWYLFLYSVYERTTYSMNVEVVFSKNIKTIEGTNEFPIFLDEAQNEIYITCDEIEYPYSIRTNLEIVDFITKKSLNINLKNSNSMALDVADREDYKLPQYGLISNGGTIEFLDTKNEIEEMYLRGWLTKNLPYIIYLENTLTRKKEKLATYETKQFEYSNLNRLCRITYEDGLTKLQDIQIPSINYDARYPQSQSAYWYYEQIIHYVPFVIRYDSETREVLENTKVSYPYLETANAWDTINKICTLCQLHAFINSEKELVLKYNGGN